MSIFSIRRRDVAALAGLLMLAATMLGVGILTIKTVEELQLMRDAEMTAKRWSNLFNDRLEDTWHTFRQRRISDFTNSVIRPSADVGRVVSFDLYDNNGHMFYSAGDADWQPALAVGMLLDSPVTRRNIKLEKTTARLHRLESPIGLRHYASVAIPFHLTDHYLGSVVAFIDQTEQAHSLMQSFEIVATATLILLSISLGAAAYVLISRSLERWRAETRLRYLSDHDELTGLPNRACFDRTLDKVIEHRPDDRSVAVIVLDINRFKEINDAYGHAAGDSVLRSVSDRIKTSVPGIDFAARLGGNEFALTLNSVSSTREVRSFLNILRKTLAGTYWANGEELSCGFAMGVAVAPADGDDVATLMRHADLALGRAKADGTNAFAFFEPSMNTAFQRRREREHDLRNAIENEELELYYQPQVCLDTNTVCGQEALLRWNHPAHGVIAPAYFIPLAEETELIIPISEWALRRACEDAMSWKAPLRIAVNLSPLHFERGGVAKLVGRILQETGLEPERLELEITESILVGDAESAVAELNKLRELGVAIAMDDFGTGYSSLSYISSFPFSKIKIDKTFTQAIGNDDALSAIVKCIIAMGNALDVIITAEGVETEEQARMLEKFGCHQVQGYLYGRPVSAQACSRQIAADVDAQPRKARKPRTRKASAA